MTFRKVSQLRQSNWDSIVLLIIITWVCFPRAGACRLSQVLSLCATCVTWRSRKNSLTVCVTNRLQLKIRTQCLFVLVFLFPSVFLVIGSKCVTVARVAPSADRARQSSIGSIEPYLFVNRKEWNKLSSCDQKTNKNSLELKGATFLFLILAYQKYRP